MGDVREMTHPASMMAREGPERAHPLKEISGFSRWSYSFLTSAVSRCCSASVDDMTLAKLSSLLNHSVSLASGPKFIAWLMSRTANMASFVSSTCATNRTASQPHAPWQ